MSEDKNIFETAAKQLGHKKKERLSSTKKSLTPYKDPETEEMLKKIKEMKEDLRNKIENIKQRSGPGGEHFKKILENKHKLSPKERDQVEFAKKLLGDKIWKSVGKSKKDEALPASVAPTDRKAKTLGIRKKWIPMR